MIEIDGKLYSKNKVKKAIYFYEALTSGEIAKNIKEALKNEL